MNYELKSGTVVTDEDIETIAEACSQGNLPDTWTGEVSFGRPSSSGERLVTASVLKKATSEQIDREFDEGRDVLRYADETTLERPNLKDEHETSCKTALIS